MSWPLLRNVFAYRGDLDPVARLVWLRLAYHANREGMAWPSLGLLEEGTGLSNASIRRAIDRLVDHRLIEVTHSRGRPSTYSMGPLTVSAGPLRLSAGPLTVSGGRRTGKEQEKNAQPSGSASRPAGSANGKANGLRPFSTAPVWDVLPDGTAVRAKP